jgi:hypothetical protein
LPLSQIRNESNQRDNYGLRANVNASRKAPGAWTPGTGWVYWPWQCADAFRVNDTDTEGPPALSDPDRSSPPRLRRLRQSARRQNHSTIPLARDFFNGLLIQILRQPPFHRLVDRFAQTVHERMHLVFCNDQRRT